MYYYNTVNSQNRSCKMTDSFAILIIYIATYVFDKKATAFLITTGIIFGYD